MLGAPAADRAQDEPGEPAAAARPDDEQRRRAAACTKPMAASSATSRGRTSTGTAPRSPSDPTALSRMRRAADSKGAGSMYAPSAKIEYGSVQAWTTSRPTPQQTASRAAQSRARRDPSDPSMPTTIRRSLATRSISASVTTTVAGSQGPKVPNRCPAGASAGPTAGAGRAFPDLVIGCRDLRPWEGPPAGRIILACR